VLTRRAIKPDHPQADNGHVPCTEPTNWVAALLGQSRHPLWRRLDQWRRRDSVLLVGAFALIEYLLIGIIIFGGLSIFGDLGVALISVPLGALLLAEATVAVRPTQQRLARADFLVVVTSGIFFACGLVGAIAVAIDAA